jgi:hypothetical protein
MVGREKRRIAGLLTVVVVAWFVTPVAGQGQVKDKLDLHKIPKSVMDALTAKFPRAEIRKWTKETEDGVVLYDIELKQDGRNFEADIKEDGTFHNWEKEIEARELPDVVKKAVEKKYPKSTLKMSMAITAVTNGKDSLEGYEIIVETADKSEVEVTVGPDGKILEDSGDKK